jgi:hypothetical protein
MDKRKLMIALAFLTLTVGAYFLFFYDKGATGAGDGEGAAVAADSLDQIDQEIKRNREALLHEKDVPTDFVEVQIDPKKNLFGESVIDGSIRNKATRAVYKDFELMIYWQDETGAVMDSAAEVIFGNLNPGESLEFKTKRRGPRKSKSIRVKVNDAKVIVN